MRVTHTHTLCLVAVFAAHHSSISNRSVSVCLSLSSLEMRPELEKCIHHGRLRLPFVLIIRTFDGNYQQSLAGFVCSFWHHPRSPV